MRCLPSAGSVRVAELRRQDSNLNCLNQNQKCCRLHHDGSLRPAVKTASTLDDRAGRSRTAARDNLVGVAAPDKEPKAPRTRRTGTERRHQLIDIARSLFAERGYEGTSIEEIALRANVSKPVVYEHFGGKEGLYAVVVDRELSAR